MVQSPTFLGDVPGGRIETKKLQPYRRTERRKEPERRAEREGAGFLQRSQSRKARIESSAARRRFTQRFILREDDGDEEEINFRENRK